ncbi:Disulfide-bond oxidoreductase YfcG [Cytospora mali]|uniref:Disulfide-bond oxidoreductase YfcG n=1 Tax=Cytospora mali TaxID=578113 RepID=A0A194UV66_CYTMA|nr:Disulfide-bond oxidoreductase YfcG [Valsa mali var. pyri (nom. inval.)]
MTTPPPDKAPKPGLNIYGCAAVNPVKLTIAAAELDIPYHYITMDIGAGDTQTDWYKAINPNGRVPALVHVKEDGTSLKIFESAACLLYMTSVYDKDHKLSYQPETPEYWSQLSWLSWQVAGYGPMMGQAAHFNRYAYDPVPYGSWRYTAESRRLNHVLDKQLSTSPFVAGDRLTIADIAVFIYAHSAKWCGVDLAEFPHVKAWHDKLLERPGFQKGLQVPVPYQFNDVAVVNPDDEFLPMMRKFAAHVVKTTTEQWQGEPVALPSDHTNY